MYSDTPLGRLRLPVICSPMFLVSGPDLVVAQCKAGVIGSFPALNARESEGEPPLLGAWLKRITEELDAHNQANPDRPAAPFAVNQIVHRSNDRIERDVEICARWKVPVWITSMGAREDVNQAAHECGGTVLHDVINNKYARKAIDKGADGLIAVCAGAGGHAGALSPFALVQEIRKWFDGPLALSGSIATGRSILAAQAMGADFGYIGSPFIAMTEAVASEEYKQMIVEGGADDIVYTDYFSGVHANYLKPSVRAVGLDPDNLAGIGNKLDLATGDIRPKAWRDIWGSGQGIGAVKEVMTTADYVDRLDREYQGAKDALCS
ncbi:MULTISPECIES: NAD(P)H-dependent flavin oxidoreductase [Rhodobacterales]|jgi:nitronate monooxygenase|uniref:2-nitropropane dioxygenase n=3 Tax=Rhodobacterales TaxID=204455 RepID=A0A0A0EA03_9RHOB|nr:MULTISPECIES: nitronate monooxygenase family protein [Rhodobacterales]AKO98974.1 Dioxygenase [Marinovum algicola DG 898]KGM47294.1 2-nitropropane dioxygenase [Pseudooceanicola atlanticus]MWB79475.1 nitronate monooxygenase [Pseudooceanicola pacificus]GGE52037.1 2-nitropropane dioxygenase [Primorskyibacter flagellatus]|tara:strand:- start:44147 stop:45112 length:966 start_codon:yes stop_codon:yes gene_type:complete